MNRILTFVIITAATLASVGTISLSVSADPAAPMTEAHIARIRANCLNAQSSLNQLHASDALLRVNRGQLYESISTKLMAPLDSRIALSKLDGVGLFSLAATYEKQLTDFRTNYQQYEEAMSRTLRINCVNQPVAFYDSVAETRVKRKATHDSSAALQQTIQSYHAAFDVFVKNFDAENRQ